LRGCLYQPRLGIEGSGRNDEALDAHRAAVQLAPNYPLAHSNLGNSLQNCGKLEEAVQAHQRAIALNPNLPQVWVNLASALTQLRTG
jgi:tetratricopeptide (TPR) repeat protein